jgi:acyl-CoA synthetase (AMP-forming)/AMP-acid ligase II
VANAVAYGIKQDANGERDPEVLEQLLSGTSTLDLIAPRGVVCELYMGGEALARGYHNRPDLTRDMFTADKFAGNGRMHQTGDLVIFSKKPGNPIESTWAALTPRSRSEASACSWERWSLIFGSSMVSMTVRFS